MSRHFNQLLANQKKRIEARGSGLLPWIIRILGATSWLEADHRPPHYTCTIHSYTLLSQALTIPTRPSKCDYRLQRGAHVITAPAPCLSSGITPSTLPPVWSQSRLNVHNIWANIGCSAAGWLHEGEMVDYRGGENSDCREGSDCRVCMTWSPKRSDLRLSLTAKVSTASGFNAMMIWRHGDMIDIRYGDLESSLTRPWWYENLMIWQSCKKRFK